MRYLTTPLIALFCCAVTSLAQAAVVESVRSYRAPEYTRLVFDLSAEVKHEIFTLENPERIVIDLSDVSLNADFSSLDIANTPITSIRSAPRNTNDARVVFDLKNKVQPRSFLLEPNDQYGNRLVIDFYDPGISTVRPVVRRSSEEIDNNKRDIVVAISAGHGGEDPGAIGVKRLQEKKVTLAISREIEKQINSRPGYRAVMVRDGDYGMTLGQRTRIAHQNNADFFIAIHADSYKSSSARGTTVYALSQRGATSQQARLLAEKENAADLIGGVGTVKLADMDEDLRSILIDLSMTASIAASLEAGNKIISSLGQVTRMRRTNVEQANFVVLRSADIPSLLVESGYITNPTDASNLDSIAWRKRFAGAIVNGITGYFYDTPPRGTYIAWHKENGGAPASYTVNRGDTLSEIADRFNVSMSALKQANAMNSNNIRIGQKLTIPNGLVSPASISFIEHTIARGETLSEIASDYSIPVARLRETNQLNSDTIRIGQVLKIPSS
ncbi:MAG: N-acetylmuramoyl-L-alanine amidase [Gammaproteobacteria bacterium]|nr:N-acetylmuramoyl-L-alanine amidase [Gammaproteobacteria bacterium]